MSSAFAQKTFSGTVIGPDGLGLPGVSVVEKANQMNGTSTDIDGNWTLTVPNGNSVLQFTSIGMKAVELPAKDTGKITMKNDSQMLDEVMVVAYGTSTKKSFTGSAAKIDGEKLEMKNTADVSKAIASEIPGVQVISSSGQPGTNAKIRIRGFGSVNSSRAPLYIVDGMPFDGDLSSIDPSDVASTTVLKDASATALYGARGSNGVILLTTKKGKRGKSNIQVNVKTGVNTKLLPMYDVVESPERFIELTWEGLKNRAIAEEKPNPVQTASENLFGENGIAPGYNMWKKEGKNLIDPATGRFYPGIQRRYTPDSWEDNMFHNGKLTEASVKFSGGSDTGSYYTSFSFRNDEGYYINSDFKRLNARVNLTQNVKNWMTVGVSMNYAFMKYNSPGQSGSMNNGFNYVNNIPRIFPVFERDADGKKIKDKLIGGYLYDYGFALGSTRNFGSNINPAGAVRLDRKENISHQIVATPYVNITFTDDIKFSTKFSVNALASETSELTNFFYGDAKGIGRVSKDNGKTLSYTWNQILSWKHSFDRHNLSAFIGHESTSYENRYLYGQKSKLANPYNGELANAVIKDDLTSSIGAYSLESYLGQIKYDYDGKYFLALDMRRDGTSRFPNDKWGNFGALGAAWVITKERFMEPITWMKNLKFKMSYGIIGNQSLLDPQGYAIYYPTYDSYSVKNLNDDISLSFNYKGNPNLTWEQSKTFNTGFEFNFNDIIEGGVEYFVKNTDNLLFYKQVARSLGYATLPVNDGKLRNSGIELELTAHVFNKKDFKLDVRFNGAHYTNEMVQMPIEGVAGKEKFIEQHGKFAYQKGRSLYDYYMREYAGVNKDTGVSEWYAYYDKVNGEEVHIENMEKYIHDNGKITELIQKKTSNYDKATQKYVGKSLIPDFAGGFGIDVSYKGFSLSTQFSYSIGGYAYDAGYAALMGNPQPGGKNWHTDIEKRWKKPGDITDVPRLSADFDKKVNDESTRFLTDASYLGLNTVNLSYDFADSFVQRLKLQKLSVFISGDNLLLFTKRNGFTPTTSEEGSTSNYRYTPLSTFSAGVKVQF